MTDKTYSIIIIGAGPAGLAAAVYTSREKISTLILEKGLCGGWASVSDLIENYPGFPKGIKGQELADSFKRQALKFGAEIIEFTEVKNIKPVNGKIKIITDKQEYNCYAAIVATGTAPKKLGIPGEEKFIGKGVSFCATCDGPLFKNKNIIVVGGGNAALEETLFLSRFAKKVTLIHRRDEFRGTKMLQEELKLQKNVEFLLNHELVSIEGKKYVDSVIAQNKKTKEQKTVEAQGVFIYVGFLPNSEILKGIVDFDESGFVKTDDKMQTSKAGIFAAGDIRSKTVYQIITACAEGVVAALSVRDYLKQIRQEPK